MKSKQQLLSKLVKIPSVTGETQACKRAVSWVKDILGTQFACKQFESKKVVSALFYSKRYTHKTRFSVILNAHLDVVPGNRSQFTPVVKAGRLYGRGAQDMKAGAVVMIKVFQQLADVLTYPIALQIVTDEETGGANGVRYQLQHGVRADFVISGESTQLDIVHKAKGIMRVQLETKGVSAHSAYPWNGKNAIEQMVALLENVKKIFPRVKGNMWRSSYNVATIQTTNTASNVIPDNCSCVLDVRYVKEEFEVLKRDLLALNGERTRVNIEYVEPAHHSNSKDTRISVLSTAEKRITGTRPKIRGAHGASDVRHYDEAGMTGVEFGPIGAGLHTDNEWVDLTSLEQYEKILTDFLLSLDNR